MEVGTLEDSRLQIQAQAIPFHRKDKSVLDLGNGGDKFPVPTGVESAHRLLDKCVGLAEGRVYGRGKSDRTRAIVRSEGPMPRFRQRCDLAAFGQTTGPAEIRHDDVN